MRNVILAIPISLAPISATPEITKEHIDVCESWGGFAELSMNAHQERRPLSEQMKLSPDPRAYEILLEAYETPRFQSDDMKKDASASYRDRIYAECLASLSGSGNSGDVRPASFWSIDK